MFRTIDFVIFVLMFISAAATYYIKHQSEIKREDLRILENKIIAEQNYIDLLKANLAVLAQPERINNLVTYYSKDLKLHPTNPVQLITIDDLSKLKWRSVSYQDDIVLSHNKIFRNNRHPKKAIKKY
ncbi:MAG: hypothetical protein C4617_05205 [Candidatus Liberibacter europaeus]|uniref:Cell division protein FtsL n=1 Tax=Candidatus Liberibacter europaeus TaxID=744859 RepID=A0A2T4VWK9_9HYPH|nr:hypothetical protein [Candidatus Liberibacter europaeus]PTL86165.1 MAG: hypothetical protein C4617_05205 [Candidatus Liberibacter europaeus]